MDRLQFSNKKYLDNICIMLKAKLKNKHVILYKNGIIFIIN